ncbi:MAG TPA: subclass B1 metallo-beta-lactamase [Candidatus Binatia bacterium]|nr:subclass B1 metallo-beta-lactamase [Candidatus Binatia bacterium]
MVLAFSAAAPARPNPRAKASPENTSPSRPSVELRLLRPGVWIHTSLYDYPDGHVIPANGLVVREKDGLVLIDTAWGELMTVDLLDRIAREIKLPVRRAIVTHAHMDRLAGADVLRRRGIPVFAHPLTITKAEEAGLPIPSHPLADLRRAGDAEWIGSVEVFDPGTAHAPGNVMVWVPSERILFGGCAVKSADATSLGNLADADTHAWPGAIRRAMERYPATTIVVPGHGAEGGKDLLTHTLDLLSARR